jgi:hypothetical protein
MKHSYIAGSGCSCNRCSRERARRDAQRNASPRDGFSRPNMNRLRKRERRPVPGSQEWAETRGDDLGESPDY